MVEFQYTVEEQDHLQDLRLWVFLDCVVCDTDDPESLRKEAEYLREYGAWGDPEVGPQASDLGAPSPQDLEEAADEIECSMWRGEHL